MIKAQVLWLDNNHLQGSGKSGTNDKAGDVNLFRLFNQRNIKINHDFKILLIALFEKLIHFSIMYYWGAGRTKDKQTQTK